MAGLVPVWTDFVSGSLTSDLPPASAGTSQTMTSAGLTALGPVVNGTQFAKIVLDPFAVNGAPELVYVLSHTTNANTATVQRQAGQPLRDHPPNETWVHGPTAEDFQGLYGLLNTFQYQTQQASFTGGPTSGTTELTLVTMNIPNQIQQFKLDVAAYWPAVFATGSTAGDLYYFRVKVNGSAVATVVGAADVGSGSRFLFSVPTTTVQTFPANSGTVSVTVTVQRWQGTGTVLCEGQVGTNGLVTARMSFFS